MNYVQKLEAQLKEELEGQPQELIDLYVLLGLMLGPLVDEEAVHNAWSVWKNRIDPTHRSIVPFEELSPEVQALDTKYVNAIVRAVQHAQES